MAAFAFAALTATAFAEPAETPKPRLAADQVMVQAAPIELTDAQMDQVTAGKEKPMQGEVLAFSLFGSHGEVVTVKVAGGFGDEEFGSR
jgi:hypothetical protein